MKLLSSLIKGVRCWLLLLWLLPLIVSAWCSCCIELSGVSQSFPDTLWRKLTSSVPRREKAIDNLSLLLESEFCLLVGASSSGKSTLLKLICGSLVPTLGTVTISTRTQRESQAKTNINIAALPVLLDERPVYGNQRTVESILTEPILSSGLPESSSSELRDDLLDIFRLSLLLEKKALDLSPSERYRCRLAEACLQSMLSHSEPFSSESLPAPILLLDEWMDTETSTVIQNVQPSLETLAERGGVVVSVTHKPHLYQTQTASNIRHITLNRGAILPFTP